MVATTFAFLHGVDQMTADLAHPQVAFQSDVPHGLKQPIYPVVAADVRLHPIAPGTFDEGPPPETTAGLRDAAGMLGWRESEIGGEPTRIVEPLEIPDIGHHLNRDDEGCAPHRRNGLRISEPTTSSGEVRRSDLSGARPASSSAAASI